MLHDVSYIQSFSHSWIWTTSIAQALPLFPFSANLGTGWHMFLPLAIALHTLDHKSGGNTENRVLLQVSKPNRCERSFQICKVDLKFGVDISSPIPHLNTKDVAKKIRNVHMEMASQCQVPDSQGESAAYAPVQRHPEICCHFQKNP